HGSGRSAAPSASLFGLREDIAGRQGNRRFHPEAHLNRKALTMVGITNKTLTAEIRRQQQLSQSIIAGQAAISSGVTLTKPSDNALAWVQVSDIGRAQAQQAAWQANVGYGATRASNAESNLDEINNLLVRAQDLVISARNGSLNDTSRGA